MISQDRFRKRHVVTVRGPGQKVPAIRLARRVRPPRRGTRPYPVHYPDCDLLRNPSLSSRKISMMETMSCIPRGRCGAHCRDLKAARTEVSSALSRRPLTEAKSIRCILWCTWSQTSKTVAGISELSCIARACWTASDGLSASMSISQITRNSIASPGLLYGGILDRCRRRNRLSR
jgi:hypothetical protein